MTPKTNSGKSPTAAISYIPHILSIVTQVYCGIFLILVMGPLLYAILSHRLGINFELLFRSFPAWWNKLSTFSTGEKSIIIFCSFPIGFIFAEVFYRFATFIGYMKEINLEDPAPKEDPTPEEDKLSQIKHFKTRCYIQRDISLQRVWDWEDSQSKFCLYLEATLLVFCFLFGLSILYTSIVIIHDIPKEPLEIFWMLTWLAILLLSICLICFMREARIKKFKALHLAYRAIIVFGLLLGLSILCTSIVIILKDIPKEPLEIFWMLTCLVILLLSIFLFCFMRKGRIEKVKALESAHKAIQEILDEEKNHNILLLKETNCG